MGYLICQECGGYYKLEKGESKEDFVSCECYGSLTYVDDIDGYLKENNEPDTEISMNVNDKSIETEFNNFEHGFDNERRDGFVDKTSLNDFEEEPSQIKEKSESISFPSFKGSDSKGVKNRNYYREINSKDKKPDIGKLKLIKDVNGIIEALNYDDSEVKLEAVKALGSIGDERALEPLDKFKIEEKGILKTYAENAIFHILSKKSGLKSQNRAYYREEYNKEISSKPDGNQPINQSINKVKDEIPEKSKQVSKKNRIRSVGDIGTLPSDTVSADTVSDTVANPSPFKSKGNHVNNRYSKKNPDEENVFSNNTNAVNEDKGISNLEIDLNEELQDGEVVSKPKTRNMLSNPFSKSKTIPEQVNTSKHVTTKKSSTKTDQTKETITQTKSAKPDLSKYSVKNLNSLNSNTSRSNSPILTSSAHNKNIIPDTTLKSVGIKDTRETEVIDGDYFIQFLGIKNTDKPLIGFIFLFAASLILGVLLTMGYK